MTGGHDTFATVSAVETGLYLTAFAVNKAMADGRQRAAALRAVDQAHARGQNLVIRGRLQRRAADLEVAAAAKAKLLAVRARLHG